MLALHKVLEEGIYDVRYLLTSVNALHNRVSMHGVRESLLMAQAESIGIPLLQVRLPDSPDMESYEQAMRLQMTHLKDQGITHSVFGDIFLEDLRAYRENKLSELGFLAVFPLWKRDTKEILKEFIGLGYKTVVVSARENLADVCGRVIDDDFIKDLPKDVDPCGENGEFHTFVYDGPLFKKTVAYTVGEKIFRTFPAPSGTAGSVAGYWYLDLIG